MTMLNQSNQDFWSIWCNNFRRQSFSNKKGFKEINYHIICHSTGCGLGTFLAKNNKKNCKSLILINPWNKTDDNFRSLQKKRIENAKKMDRISYLNTEYELLYSNNYI